MFGLPRGAKSFLQFWAAEVSEKRETQETSIVLTGIVECLIDSNCGSHNNQGDPFSGGYFCYQSANGINAEFKLEPFDSL